MSKLVSEIILLIDQKIIQVQKRWSIVHEKCQNQAIVSDSFFVGALIEEHTKDRLTNSLTELKKEIYELETNNK